MTFAPFAESVITLDNDRISSEDAQRQTRAALELLSRLDRQPGVVLADEVGMGKTFVAMAVSLSILIERPTVGPVVVMSPPSLRHKWPKDWKVFLDKCVGVERRDSFRAATADSGVEFLKLLDDPDSRRVHIIFLTHGALHRAVRDRFVKLAIIKRAFKGRGSLSAQRESFGRWASRILGMEWVERRGKILGRLLERPCDTWRRTILRADERLEADVPDDPVTPDIGRLLG